jgi:hypothetical protein
MQDGNLPGRPPKLMKPSFSQKPNAWRRLTGEGLLFWAW